MRARLMLVIAWLACSVATASAQAPKRTTLDIYSIDVEGGQATLFVTPSGTSMLVDTGFPGFNGRDADRIAAAARDAGLTRIDHVVITHYHRDHVGGVPQLVAKIPVGTFVDHGPTVETSADAVALFREYETIARGRRQVVRPGDRIAVPDLDVRVVSSAGSVLQAPLAGAGDSNGLCRGFEPKDPDPTENASSVGIVVAFGRFRMADLGDLTWNTERDLVCPANRIGKVDLYMVSHHGTASSGSPALVHGMRPRVAVMNNGAKKGGSKEAWQTVRSSPGLEDFWQLHTAVDNGADYNTADRYIANPDETTSHWIKISAQSDGSFVVTNQRNGFSKTYVASSGAGGN